VCQLFSFLISDSSVTAYRCKHFIIDAGHIAIESDLASKEAIHTIHQKRNQKYTEEDYKQLESLMYDKLSLRLQDAQVSCCYLSSSGLK
jgi:vacuolar protein sorting-associated protein 13A/C